MHIMFLDPLHSHPSHFSPITHIFLPNFMWLFPSFFKSLIPKESTQCYQYVHGCSAIYWSMGSFSYAASLKKINSPSSCVLSIASQTEVGIHEPLPHPHWDLGWLSFVQGLYILTAVGSSCAQLCCHVQQIHVPLETLTSFHSYNLSTPWALGKWGVL